MIQISKNIISQITNLGKNKNINVFNSQKTRKFGINKFKM